MAKLLASWSRSSPILNASREPAVRKVGTTITYSLKRSVLEDALFRALADQVAVACGGEVVCGFGSLAQRLLPLAPAEDALRNALVDRIAQMHPQFGSPDAQVSQQDRALLRVRSRLP